MTDKNVKLLHIFNTNQFSKIEMKRASPHEPKLDRKEKKPFKCKEKPDTLS